MINATKAAQIFSVNGEFIPTKTSTYLLTSLFNNRAFFDVSSQTVIDAGNFSVLTDSPKRIFYTDVEAGYSGSGYLIYPSDAYPSFSTNALNASVNVSAGTTTIVAGVPGKKIRVLGWYVAASLAPGSYTWLSGVTSKTGVIPVGINGGGNTDVQFTCATGDDLNITTVGADIDGIVNYEIIDPSVDTNDILDAVINVSAGTTKVLDAIAGKIIQIVGWYAGANTAGSYTWVSNITPKTGIIPVGANGGSSTLKQITCGSSEDLNLTAVVSDIDGLINYRVIDAQDDTLDAIISAPAGSTGLTVVTGVPGKIIRVTGWNFASTVAVGSYTLLSAANPKTGTIPIGVFSGGTPNMKIACGVGEDLNITTVGSGIYGVINYTLEDEVSSVNDLDSIINVSAGTTKVLDGVPGKRIQVSGWHLGASIASGSYTWLSGTDVKTGVIPIGINGVVSTDIQITCGVGEDLNITSVGTDIDGILNYSLVDAQNGIFDVAINVAAGSTGLAVISGTSGQKIRVVGWYIGASLAPGSYTWLSAGDSSTGVVPVGVNGGVATNAQITCGVGEDLNITTVGSDIDGIINYVIADDPDDFSIVQYPIKNTGNNDLYVRLKDPGGIGSCNIEVNINSALKSVYNITFAGLDWEWHSLGSISLSNGNIYDLGIRLYTEDIVLDQIAINPSAAPAGNSALTQTESPFITAHIGVYEVDGSSEPTTPLYIHDFKTSISELRQDGWYNFDLNFIDSSLTNDFLDSYALYFSVSGSNNKNFITWERVDADEYSLEPSVYNE